MNVLNLNAFLKEFNLPTLTTKKPSLITKTGLSCLCIIKFKTYDTLYSVQPLDGLETFEI